MTGRIRNHKSLKAVLLALALVLGACGEDKQSAGRPRPPTENEPPVVATVPVEPVPQTPAPKAHPVTAKTTETYQWYCAQCHGVKGKGNGINAPHTAVPPRDHTKAAYLETRSDEQLFHVIKFGGLAGGRAPCMPRWGHTLDDDMIHSLVNYIRELCHCEAL